MSKHRIVEASSTASQSKAASGWSLSDVLNRETLDTSRGVIAELLGESANVTKTLSRNLDLQEGPNHSTTGIPYAIHGTATLVQQRVATALAKYQDPIRAILPTAVHGTKRIVIRRKYVVGGQATITPERAPARTVAVREDERTVVLTRYGGDLEMNLNLFLIPDQAKEEFNMKLDAQTRQLEQMMVTLGYDALLEQGTQLLPALTRMMPQREDGNRDPDQTANSEQAERVYIDTLFGAIQKARYPLQNLMAAAKMAGLYAPAVNGGYDTCILPTGLLEMERVTKRENMEYYLTGTPEGQRKQVKVELENVYQDPRVPNMRLMIHHPFPNFDHGAAYPTPNQSALSRDVTIAIHYHYQMKDTDKIRYPNHKTNSWTEVTATADGQKLSVVQDVTLSMASAIMAVSGSNTGELLYAYPSTGISTSQTTEAMKMQLRVYMGAVVYDPTRILILPDVHLEGIKHAELHEYEDNSATPLAALGMQTQENVRVKHEDANVAKEGTAHGYYSVHFKASKFGALQAAASKAANGTDATAVAGKAELETLMAKGAPTSIHRGHIQLLTDKGWKTVVANSGHLGALDCPNDPGLRGQFRFSDKP